MKNCCEGCHLNAKLLHPDMPFGCFGSWCDGYRQEVSEELTKKWAKESQDEWIKNHPNWKGTPHIKWWYYENDRKKFDEFLKMYPDAEHAPNDSWKDMYDIVILK